MSSRATFFEKKTEEENSTHFSLEMASPAPEKRLLDTAVVV
jgi:hypothetical protein